MLRSHIVKHWKKGKIDVVTASRTTDNPVDRCNLNYFWSMVPSPVYTVTKVTISHQGIAVTDFEPSVPSFGVLNHQLKC